AALSNPGRPPAGPAGAGVNHAEVGEGRPPGERPARHRPRGPTAMATITDHLPDTRKLRKRARREADQLRARAAKEARVLGRRAGAAMEELREATAARAAEIREDLRTLP